MNILKAIGGFFTKLWRWIKETAWVQPLLIVGAIFAVIFSIPKITGWVESWGLGSASRYFAEYQQSLEGETEEIGDFSTKADQLTKIPAVARRRDRGDRRLQHQGRPIDQSHQRLVELR